MLQLYLFHSLNESFCTIIFNIEIKGLLFCDILSSGIVFDLSELKMQQIYIEVRITLFIILI